VWRRSSPIFAGLNHGQQTRSLPQHSRTCSQRPLLPPRTTPLPPVSRFAMDAAANNAHVKRERSRSPRRRSRSPRRRSYSPRSRSRSRDGYRNRRSRTPLGNTGASAGYSNSYGAGRGAASRGFEDRASKEQMMSNIRENSQQDRRVYVGNLSYDVKWHHLKDFMRQGELLPSPARHSQLTTDRSSSW
jgi:hypothetical protein